MPCYHLVRHCSQSYAHKNMHVAQVVKSQSMLLHGLFTGIPLARLHQAAITSLRPSLKPSTDPDLPRIKTDMVIYLLQCSLVPSIVSTAGSHLNDTNYFCWIRKKVNSLMVTQWGLGFGVWGLGFGVWEIGRAHV